jgi:hypothetical protein
MTVNSDCGGGDVGCAGMYVGPEVWVVEWEADEEP